MIVLEWSGAIIMLAGAIWICISALGIARWKDTLSRMHAATKPQLFAFAVMMIGLALYMHTLKWVVLVILAIGLQAIATPVAAQVLGHARVKEMRTKVDRQAAENMGNDGHSAPKREKL